MRRIFRIVPLAALAAAAFLPAQAEAQYGYPPYYRYPYGAYRYEREADVQIKVHPRDASVYVDGYFAGKVDDFDGALQRLHVAPGTHEIVIYLKGYRSLHEKRYLSFGRTQHIEGNLAKLEPNEAQEPEPKPVVQPEPAPGSRPPANRTPPDRAPLPRRPPPPPRNDPRDRDEPQQRESRFGTLSIQVQPSGSTVFIDGQRWTGPTDDERLLIQVPGGRHHIEVERSGYERYSADIEVDRGRTENVNISLTRDR